MNVVHGFTIYNPQMCFCLLTISVTLKMKHRPCTATVLRRIWNQVLCTALNILPKKNHHTLLVCFPGYLYLYVSLLLACYCLLQCHHGLLLSIVLVMFVVYARKVLGQDYCLSHSNTDSVPSSVIQTTTIRFSRRQYVCILHLFQSLGMYKILKCFDSAYTDSIVSGKYKKSKWQHSKSEHLDAI